MYSSWALFVLYEVQLDNKLPYGRRRQINSTPLKLLDKNTCHKNIVAHDKNTCRRNSAAHGKNTCCTITRLSDCLLHEYYHCNSEFAERIRLDFEQTLSPLCCRHLKHTCALMLLVLKPTIVKF